MKKRFTFNYQPIFRVLNALLPRQWNSTWELKLHSHTGTVSCVYVDSGNNLNKNLIQSQQKQHLFFPLRIFLLLTLVSSLSLQQVFATTFPCDDVSYRLQGNPSALYKVDLETGIATQLFSASTLGNRKMTALGYSPEDGFLYAYQSGTNDIIQIHNDGGTSVKDITGLPSNVEYNAGEISKDGIFYLYRSGDATMQKVDISARTTSTLTLSASSSVGDISISADAKYIYGIATNNGQMVTYNASTGARTLTDVGIPAMTTSTYIDKSGNLFFINDANSTVYQVTGPNSSPDTESGVQVSPTLNTAISTTDGARCTNAFAPLQPTFSCATFKSYLFQGDGNADGGTLNSNTRVYEINIVNGSSTQVHGQLIPSSSNSKTSVNNVGFNITDSYLWGFRRGTNQLVRMGSDWSVSFFAISGLPTDVPFNAGDIDANGILYLFRGHQNVSSSQVLRVDLKPSSSTYLTLLSPLTLAPVDATREMIDLAINPVDGHLYGINATTGNLLRINSSTGAVSTVGATNIPIANPVSNAFGACYFDNAGTLYVSQNSSGKIYRIPKAATSATGIFVSNGPVTDDNDGARCFQQPITELASLSGNIFDDGNALTDNLVNKSGTGSVVIDGTDIDDDVAGNQPIYATLVNSSGVAVTTVPVISTGTYSFLAVSPGTYSVVLSTNASGSTMASLPTNWNNTGEKLGTTTGSDGTVNGILTGLSVSSADIENANFGINKKPDVNNATLAAQPNPGGTNQALVASTAFTGTDLEDGTYTNNLTGRTVTLTPAANATLYYNGSAVSTTLVVTSFDPTKVTIDPTATGATSAGNHPTFTYSVKDNAGVFADPATVTVPFTAPVTSISGNVFDDGNGLTDNTVNKSGASSIVINGSDIDPVVSDNQPIYVTLVNSSNVALATVQVSSTGTYTFTGVAPGNYTIVLTTNSAGSTSTSLPASWTNVGEKLGTGTGSDGSANGILTGITVASSNVTDANFGINKKPDVNDATLAAQTNPGGTVQAPVSSTAFTGTDLEDGTYTNNLTGRTVTLTPAANATLYYNGSAVSTTLVVTSFDPTKVTIDPTATGATSAGNHPTFTYSVKDNAGVFADPATVTVPFTAPVVVTVSLSGSVLNDGNGLTDNLVNKSGTSSIVINGTDIDPAVTGNQPIYVTLVNSGGTSLTTVQVSSTGTYTFNGVAAGTYSVVLSTNAAGSTSMSLPTSWTSVGEHLGTGTGSDGPANGILTGLVVASSNVTDANFGIDKKPVVNDATVTAQVNPGGTAQAPVSSTAFTGSDLEDGTYPTNLTGRTVILTPATNGTLYYSGTAVTGTQTITSFDPTKVTLDPTATGATTGSSGASPDPTFTYAVKDNAGVVSDPKTVTVPFTLGVPDLTPIIYALPATQYGTTNFTVVIDVYNLLPTASNGLITLYVTKDPLVKLSFNNSSVLVGNKVVQNGIWTFDERNADFYILTTTEVITGEGHKSFGLTGVLTPGNTKGTLTISTTIVGRSGGEVRIDNNSDADKIDYFKK